MGVGTVEPVMLMGSLPILARDGDGNGNGYGDGDGDGDGDGKGYGYGNGDGNGYGYGDGDGKGYGYGYGDGDGYGYGDGDGLYWAATIEQFAAKWPQDQIDRLAHHQSIGSRIAFWRSLSDGRAANGGSCMPVKVGTVHVEHGPLRDDCGPGQLHATLIPPKWEGERVWIVALMGQVRGDDEKMWALEREILGEAL